MTPSFSNKRSDCFFLFNGFGAFFNLNISNIASGLSAFVAYPVSESIRTVIKPFGLCIMESGIPLSASLM